MPAQPLEKDVEGEVGIVRLRAEFHERRHLPQVERQIDLAHVLGVVIAQLATVVQPQHQRIPHPILFQRLAVAQPAGQHRVDHEGGPVIESQQQKLAAAAHIGESAPGHVAGEVVAQQVAHDDRPAHLCGGDAHAGQARGQVLADHFEIGKFGHRLLFCAEGAFGVESNGYRSERQVQ